MAQAAACKSMATVRVTSSSFPCYTPRAAASHRLTARANLPGLSMRHYVPLESSTGISSSLLLPHELHGMPLQLHSSSIGTDERKEWCGRRPAGEAGVHVRASTIGEVVDVRKAAKELYYNVVLSVPAKSEVAKWYTTPGQYVYLIPVKTQQPSASVFFIASPVLETKKRGPADQRVAMEFLVEDVAGTVNNELVNSKRGDGVAITTDSWSAGFDMSRLNDIQDSESVLMFASGYGLGPFRALIETGFSANKRRHAVLYTFYTPEQQPYEDRYPAWEATGVKVQRGVSEIELTDPARTSVLMVASQSQQQRIAKYFEEKGVPADNIQTLFDGISDTDQAYYSKVLHKLKHYPRFSHCGKQHVPVELKI